MTLKKINKQITNDISNQWAISLGYKPIYSVSENSKIILISQAPGRVSQEKNIAWDDASGKTLKNWLGVTENEFYNLNNFAILPMDFYYPGKDLYGDLPPRKEFARLWHLQILNQMNNVRLKILIGGYAQKYYLFNEKKSNLTKKVSDFETFLPEYFPIVHPSPLNFRWKTKNPWFESEVIPKLQKIVKGILAS
ncbi:MAG: uracil-DNA glycosylase family protein [candidate division SR1 bacterium]|nr:uracil-DNA glycosylase family protein [candidate division SR1 bacterium]